MWNSTFLVLDIELILLGLVVWVSVVAVFLLLMYARGEREKGDEFRRRDEFRT